MKTFCLVILTFFALYNPKVDAKIGEIEIHTVEKVELELDQIVIDKKYPLKNIDENLKNFTALMKIFKTTQLHNINLSQKLLEKVQNHNTLSGDDLYLIKKCFNLFVNLNSRILEFGNLYQLKAVPMSKAFAMEPINPRLVKANVMWLAANLLAMDNMESGHEVIYSQDGSFRRIFKSSFDPKTLSTEEKKTLKGLTEQMNSLTDIIENKKFSQQVILVRSIADKLKAALVDSPDALQVLNEVSTNKIANDMATGRSDFKLAIHGFSDAVVGLFNKVTNFLSGFFGNVAGNIHWRKGYLFDNAPALKLATETLRPMDIILEKSPFVLTDKFIPGHYGHVAIYLGTKDQLTELGLWSHPDIVPYHDDIEAGKTILEAIRPGVHLNSVKGFMNIDQYTIMRKTDSLESLSLVNEEISRGMDQIGKKYDFNFDISTLDKIVCSELIYIVFGHVTWPTRYRLGRPTITPDDIGEVLFQKNTRFKMTDYVISTKRQTLEHANLKTLADIYEYELRASNGDPIKDPADPDNSFWKKETKCYNVGHAEFLPKRKSCKTTYKEYIYEEAGNSIND